MAKYKLMTESQRKFCAFKEIKVGGSYMFPRMGFTVFDSPNFDNYDYVDTNPFTKSLDNELFKVKEIIDGFCKGNFSRRPKGRDFYLLKEELEFRGTTLAISLLLLAFVPCALYNAITYKKQINSIN